MRFLLLAIVLLLGPERGEARADGAKDLDTCANLGEHGRDDTAITYCSRALDSGNLSADDKVIALTNRAIGYRNLRKFDAAIQDCNAALKLQPDHSEAHSACANAYAGKADYGKAVDSFSHAITLKPGFADFYNNRGNIYDQMGDYERAAADFDTAIRLNPDFALALFNRGIVLFNRGRFPEAAAALKIAVEAEPENAYAVLWWALAQRRAGRDAAADLEAAVQELDLDTWPGSLMPYFQGKAAADSGTTVADPSPDVEVGPPPPSDDECEESFYLGELDVIGGRTDAAKRRLQRAADTCPKTFIEHAGALAELARM